MACFDSRKILLASCFISILSLVGANDPIIRSPVSSGQSSFILFPDAIAAHETETGKGDFSMLSGYRMSLPKHADTIRAFVDTYGHHLGVRFSELEESRTHIDAASGLAYHHFDQFVSGYKVYAGDIVVTLSLRGGGVVESSGNAMPASKVKDKDIQELTVVWQQHKESILRSISEYLQHEVGKSLVVGLSDRQQQDNDQSQSHQRAYSDESSPHPPLYSCSRVEVTTEWLRSELFGGKGGDVALVKRVNAVCEVSSHSDSESTVRDDRGAILEVLAFEAFVDCQSGHVVQLIDKTSRGRVGSLLRRDLQKGKGSYDDKVKDSEVSEVSGVSLGQGRRLSYYDDIQATVKRYGSSEVVYFDDSSTFIPDVPEDLEPALTHSVGFTRLMRAITNQEFLSFKKAHTPLSIYILMSQVNAYYDGFGITLGRGLAVADVVAHEWAHGYTDSTSDLIYAYESGALNEGLSDIFGESYNLLVSEGGRGLRPRGEPHCSHIDWSDRDKNFPLGQNTSLRWLVGEEVRPSGSGFNTCGQLCVFRDMYFPECFGHPSTTQSRKYRCESGDNGGVHSNSGVLNRLYALLVDGGTQDGVTVQPIGLLKALQLMWKMQLRLTSGSTFFDFATGLKSLCRLSIGAELYELDFVEGISTVSSETIGSVDCDMVDIALDLSKMFESPCTDTGPSHESTFSLSAAEADPIDGTFDVALTGGEAVCSTVDISGGDVLESFEFAFFFEDMYYDSDASEIGFNVTLNGVCLGVSSIYSYGLVSPCVTANSFKFSKYEIPNSDISGTYSAQVNVSRSGLTVPVGPGSEVTVCLFNRRRASRGVRYQGTLTMHGLKSRYFSPTISPGPSSAPSSSSPTLSFMPTSSPTRVPKDFSLTQEYGKPIIGSFHAILLANEEVCESAIVVYGVAKGLLISLTFEALRPHDELDDFASWASDAVFTISMDNTSCVTVRASDSNYDGNCTYVHNQFPDTPDSGTYMAFLDVSAAKLSVPEESESEVTVCLKNNWVDSLGVRYQGILSLSGLETVRTSAAPTVSFIPTLSPVTSVPSFSPSPIPSALPSLAPSTNVQTLATLLCNMTVQRINGSEFSEEFVSAFELSVDETLSAVSSGEADVTILSYFPESSSAASLTEESLGTRSVEVFDATFVVAFTVSLIIERTDMTVDNVFRTLFDAMEGAVADGSAAAHMNHLLGGGYVTFDDCASNESDMTLEVSRYGNTSESDAGDDAWSTWGLMVVVVLSVLVLVLVIAVLITGSLKHRSGGETETVALEVFQNENEKVMCVAEADVAGREDDVASSDLTPTPIPGRITGIAYQSVVSVDSVQCDDEICAHL